MELPSKTHGMTPSHAMSNLKKRKNRPISQAAFRTRIDSIVFSNLVPKS